MKSYNDRLVDCSEAELQIISRHGERLARDGLVALAPKLLPIDPPKKILLDALPSIVNLGLQLLLHLGHAILDSLGLLGNQSRVVLSFFGMMGRHTLTEYFYRTPKRMEFARERDLRTHFVVARDIRIGHRTHKEQIAAEGTTALDQPEVLLLQLDTAIIARHSSLRTRICRMTGQCIELEADLL